MGRWAQRSRAGGGVNVPASMIHAEIDPTDEAIVSFSRPVLASLFGPFSVVSNPSGAFFATAAQTAADQITFDFAADISTDTSITVNGPIAGLSFPQTVDYT